MTTNKKKEHKHAWHFIESWEGVNSDTGAWLKITYKFVCDCGKIKIVNEKS